MRGERDQSLTFHGTDIVSIGDDDVDVIQLHSGQRPSQACQDDIIVSLSILVYPRFTNTMFSTLLLH